MHPKKQLAPLVIILTIAVAMMMSSCGGSWKVNGKRIITYVNGDPISYAVYDSVVKNRKIRTFTPEQSEKKKREVLNELIDKLLTDQRIDSINQVLNENPGFLKKKMAYLEKPALKLLYENEISSKVEITDEEAKKYYEDNIKKYTTPEQVRASHILIKTEIDSSKMDDKKAVAAADRKAKKKAEKIYKRVMKGDDFAILAKEFSADPGSARRGGDLGFFQRGRMVKAFEETAFPMEIGDISEPIKSEFGYHIIKKVDHRPEEIKPFDDARKEQIKSSEKATRERKSAEAYIDSIKASSDIKYNDELLASDEDTTLKKNDWVAIINGADTLIYDRYREQKPRYMRFKNIEEMTREEQEEMIKTLSVNNLLAKIAADNGYFDDSLIVAQGNQYVLTQAKNRVEDLMSAKTYEPTDSAARAHFEEHIEEYVVEKPLHVYHIIFTDSTMAAVIYDSLKAGADFVDMAKRYYPGEPEIREVAYDLDFISEKEMPVEFWNAANELQVGSICLPVQTEWGWHIIKLVSRKRSKTFEQVKSKIKNTLKKEADIKAKDEYLAKLHASADIKINENLLAEYVITNYTRDTELKLKVPKE